MFRLRRPVPDPAPGPGSGEALEAAEQRRALERILAAMPEKRRVVFALYEIDEYSGEEIDRFLSIPVNTVWTRLHHARKEFFALCRAGVGKEGR